jgi:hypothetical protein
MSVSLILATLFRGEIRGLWDWQTWWKKLVHCVLQKYHYKPLEKEAKSIVAESIFLQYLNKLFQIQISAGDIIQFESGNTSKY